MGDRIQLELVLFRTLVNIQGGFFRRNCFRLKAINFFCKELLLKCLTGSIRPYDEWWWFKRHAMPIWHDNVDATLISQRQTHYMFTTPVLWRCVSVAKNHLKYQLLLNYSYCIASFAQRWFKAGNKNKSCVSYVESLYCDKKFRLIFPYHTLNVSKMRLQEICKDGYWTNKW